MATVVGKTSIRIDELLQDFLTSLEIGPDGKIISTTRGGLVSNLGTIVLPGDLDTAINQTQVSAQQYADLQINAATTELNDTIAVETQQVRDYSDAQLANEVILINNSVAAVDARVDSTDATVNNLGTAMFDISAKANAAGRIYFQTSPPTGDAKYLWIDTTNGNNTPKRWNGTTWVIATDKVATDAATAATALGVRVTDVEGEVTSHESRLVTAEGEIGSHESRITSAEGVITSTSSNVSNLTSTVSSHTTRLTSAEGNITSIDGRVDNAELSINSHETRIGDAEDEITNIVNIQLPGKTKTTYSTNPPGTTANTAGDTWFQKVGGEIIGQWQGGGGTSWIQLTLTDSVVTNLKAGTITSGTFAGDRIGANTIDSTKIVTTGLDAGVIKFGEMEGDRIKAGTLLINRVTNLQTTLDSKATPAQVTAAASAAEAAAKTYADAEAEAARLAAIATASGDATAKADAAEAAAKLAAAADALTKANAAQAAAIAAAATDATTKANAAAVEAIESGWSNTNSTFSDWTGTTPAYFGTWSSSAPVKNTVDSVYGPYAVEYNAAAAANEGMAVTSSFDAIPLGVEYVTVEVDVMLKAGNFSGAGVLVDWVGTSPVRNSLKLHTIIPSPQLSKWYRVTQVLKRPGTGTQTDWNGYLMANYGSDGLGALSAKHIIYDRLGLRPSTQEEITAYNTPGYIATAKTEAINAAATDATSKADAARTNAVADLKTMWGHPNNTTLIDGGDIYTNSIKASSIMVADWTNYWPNPRFEYAAPVVGDSSTEAPPDGGAARQLASRDHIAPEKFYVKEADTYRIELVAKRTAGARVLNAGIWLYNAAGVQTASPWLNAPLVQLQALSNGWARYGADLVIPARTPPVGLGALYFQIPQGAGVPYDTVWHVSNIMVRRRFGGELIVDGAIDGKTITGATVQTSATANRGLKLNATGLLAYDAAGVATLTINATSGAITMKGDLTSGSTITGATMTGGVLQTQPTGTNAKAIRISGNIFTAHDPAGNAVVTISGETGSVAIKGELTSGSTITGATYRTAVSGERLEINTTDLSAVKFYSGAAQEIEPGRVTSDVIDEPFPDQPTWTQRKSSVVIRAPQINTSTPTAAIELSSVQVTDPFTVEVQPQVNITGTLNASGLNVGTGLLSGGGIYSKASGTGSASAGTGNGFRWTNNDIGDYQVPVVPNVLLGRSHGMLGTPATDCPADGIKRTIFIKDISLNTALGRSKQAFVEVDLKAISAGTAAGFWWLDVSTDNGATYQQLGQSIRVHNEGVPSWDLGVHLSGWVSTMRVRNNGLGGVQSNLIKIVVNFSNDATSSATTIMGESSYGVSWFG